MPKSTNQKLKLLYLGQILEQESDENHPLGVGDLIAELGRRGIAAERKSIYADMEALAQFGLDIVTVKGRGNAYYLGGRRFELPELKLLVDAVESAKFISQSKSRSLIQKICRLASRHEGNLMQRQIHVRGRAKTSNEQTYYNVDAIQGAIAENRQIAFRYYEWAVESAAPHLIVRRARHGGETYTVSPWTLLWDDEFYYLLAYDEAAGIIKHYRVDKMEYIIPQKAQRLGRELFEKLDIGAYTKSVFGMFGGQAQSVTLRFANHLINVVVDRFGPDVHIAADGPAHFTTTIKAAVSPQFLSWLFGFGVEVKVLAPAELVLEIAGAANGIAQLYRA